MQLTIDIKDSALDKVMYLLNSLKSDVKIVDKSLNIEVIDKNDEDYHCIIDGRKERVAHPENYGTMSDIKWD